MKKIIFLIVFIMIANVGFCVLAPVHQSSKEIKTILNDQKLYKNLTPYDVIQNIVKIKNGYLIITNLHMIQVDVIVKMDEKGFAGPKQFDLKFNRPVVIDKSKK